MLKVLVLANSTMCISLTCCMHSKISGVLHISNITFYPSSILSLSARAHAFSRWPLGRATAQVDSRWALTAEAWVHVQVSPRGICGGQSGTRICFSQLFDFLLSL
jgi:hypothetical protein